MSDTPRTTALHNRLVKLSEGPDWIVGRAYCDMTDHARTLERELTAANQAFDARDKRWQQDLDAASKELARATEADISRMRKIMRERFERIEILQNELAAERAARERAEATVKQQEIYISDIKRIFCESDKKAVEELEAKVARLRETLRNIEEGCSFPVDDVQRACRDVARAALKDTQDG